MFRHPESAARPLLPWYGLNRVVAVLAVLATSLLPGCGPGYGDVSGKVYYKDKVVTSGFVTLIGQDGLPKQGEISEDGSYQISRVIAGEVKILVASPNPDPSKGRPLPKRNVPGGREPEPEAGSTLTEKQRKSWREIPLRYQDPDQSGLKYTVTTGANTYDIKLE